MDYLCYGRGFQPKQHKRCLKRIKINFSALNELKVQKCRSVKPQKREPPDQL